MFNYLFGGLKFLFNPSVSLFALVDNTSTIDKKARVYGGSKVYRSSIGKYSYLTRGSSLIFTSVGKFCSIGQNSVIGLAHHTLDKLSTSPIFTEEVNALGVRWVKGSLEEPYRKIIIGNDVWIGSRVIIVGGVTVGDGAVIAAGAIVTKDVPSYSIVAGVPAKVIRYRFDEEKIKKLLRIKWWNWDEEKLKFRIAYFQRGNGTDLLVQLKE